jgi:hypothetical protein
MLWWFGPGFVLWVVISLLDRNRKEKLPGDGLMWFFVTTVLWPIFLPFLLHDLGVYALKKFTDRQARHRQDRGFKEVRAIENKKAIAPKVIDVDYREVKQQCSDCQKDLPPTRKR